MNNYPKRVLRGIARELFDVDIVSRASFGSEIVRDIGKILPPAKVQVVFDIGANLGDTTVEFAEVFKNASIYSFEPDPATFEKLNARVKPQSRLKAYNFGFGSAAGSKALTVNKVSGGNSFLEISPAISEFAQGAWTEPVGKVSAEIRTLDDFCRENSIKEIDLVKIDTQGFELEILRGGQQVITPARTRAIHIEVLFVELYKNQVFFDEVYKELCGRGFRFVGLYNRFYKPEAPHYLLWCDALFVGEME